MENIRLEKAGDWSEFPKGFLVYAKGLKFSVWASKDTDDDGDYFYIMAYRFSGMRSPEGDNPELISEFDDYFSTDIFNASIDASEYSEEWLKNHIENVIESL